MHLRQPLSEGEYMFFAGPVPVGGPIAVGETAHLDAAQRDNAEATMESTSEAGLAGTALKKWPRVRHHFKEGMK